MPPDDSIYLFDGNAYIHRAYHAIAPLANGAGLPTHAIFGFTNILLRVLKERSPRSLAVVFDSRGPTFRHEFFPAYKSNRPPLPEDLVVQFPYVKKVVQAYRFLTLEEQGVEADDLIGAAAQRLAEAGHRVTIVSGDKDLLQLVGPLITLWDPMKDKVMDEAAVTAKYHVAPGQLTDLFALVGDSSDNVPGVPGIGPKTAAELIGVHGSLETLYARIEMIQKPKLREKLLAHQEQAFLSRRLVSLKTDLVVPAEPAAYAIPQPDEATLRDLFTELEFSSLIKGGSSCAPFATDGFRLVATAEELRTMLQTLGRPRILCVDTETNSLDPITAELVGISLCADGTEAFYLPVRHADPNGVRLDGQLSLEQVIAHVAPLLADPAIPKVGHNLKFDLAVLRTNGIELAGPLQDTMLASYLLDPTRRSQKLDDLAAEFLHKKTTSFSEVTSGDKRPDAFRYVPLDQARDYSCEDVVAALGLWRIFEPRLRDLGLWPLFADVEIQLVPILESMERAGIAIDPDLLHGLSEEFGAQINALSQHILTLAGEDFNINSPRQLAEILFEKLGLPHGRKTKTGYSTDIKVLERLGRLHPLPRLVTEHRNLTKLKSTYVDRLPEMVHPRTGRIHTSFNQTVTATGRLSSSDPNLQNIPIRTPEGQRIRAAFIPAPGQIFLSADYSQIDLRVLAHYSRDPALIEAFRDGGDIHRATAAEIFRVRPEFVTSEMRRVAKSINFGIVYGMSAFGLSEQLDIGRKEAATFIDRYFTHYSGVKRFMDTAIAEARDRGFVTTLLGRRRSLPDINSPNKTIREFAERTALNTPIQGTAADLIKLATIAVDRVLREAKAQARLLLQIHDELILEAPVSEVAALTPLVQMAMEHVVELAVPLTVNIATGTTLAKA